ncbi:silent information regulator family protein [Pelomyxa schiedti]|nr:silent information regulator family protein [Pelomyxa schiedti]
MQGFAVSPKRDCPHVVEAITALPTSIPYPCGCSVCGDVSENWLCATCYGQNCSRYVRGHASSKHFPTTSHPIALSLADLSFWCYVCEAYIEHPDLKPLAALAHHAKFDVAHHAPTATEGSSTTSSAALAPQEPSPESVTVPQLTVLTKKDEALTIADCRLPESLLLKTCERSKLFIASGELVELAASRCSDCVVQVDIGIQRGLLQIHACSRCDIIVESVVSNIVLEDCNAVAVSVKPAWCNNENNVLVAKCCRGVKLHVGGTVHTLPSHIFDGAYAFQIINDSLVEVTTDIWEAAHKIPRLLMNVNDTSSSSTAPADNTPHGHSTEDELTEHFDKPDVFASKMRQIAEIVKASSYIVVYTGAGISTAARIPDYRGPQGVWTLKDRGEAAHMDITLEEAQPTNAHMAIAELTKRDIVKHVVSTNVDGLHRKSGIPATKISELHGNLYIEVCQKCKTEYQRKVNVGTFTISDKAAASPTSTSTSTTASTTPTTNRHITGRTCDNPECGGALVDNIIHFGEPMPLAPTEKSLLESRKADLAIVLGTSMRVKPACELPLLAKRLVLCNRQITPVDQDCVIRVFAGTDEFMTSLMQLLGIEIPSFSP